MSSQNAEVVRKYAMTKLKPGDYLLPSNDGRTIWRLCQYDDGPSNGLDIPKDRTFWGVWKWTDHSDVVDPDDWGKWEMHDALLDTRADAIKAGSPMTIIEPFVGIEKYDDFDRHGTSRYSHGLRIGRRRWRIELMVTGVYVRLGAIEFMMGVNYADPEVT